MGPYRTQAEMPEEEKEVMSETIRIWKMFFISAVALVTLMTGSCTYTAIDNNRTALSKSQIDSTPLAREAAQARYLEAKALSDRAMFDQMAKSQK